LDTGDGEEMKKRIPTLEEIRVRGLRTLAEELGPFNYVRFLQQYKSGTGDYTKNRRTRSQKSTVAEIARGIKARRKKR